MKVNSIIDGTDRKHPATCLLCMNKWQWCCIVSDLGSPCRSMRQTQGMDAGIITSHRIQDGVISHNPLKQGDYCLYNQKEQAFYMKKTTITNHSYYIPKAYFKPAMLALNIFKSGIPFNKAVDQAAASYQNVNRNQLSKHLLKWIANDY